MMHNLIIFLKKNSDFVAFVIAIEMIEFILRANIYLPLIQKKAIYFNFVILLFVISLLLLFRQKKRKIIESLLLVIISIYAFAQNYHYYFFNTLFSFSKLSVVSELGGVAKEVIAKFNYRLVFIFIPLIIWFIYLKFTKNEENEVEYKKVIISMIVISLLISIVSVRLIFYKEENENIDEIKTEQFLFEKMSDKNMFLNRFGMMLYIVRDVAMNVNITTSLTNEEIEAINNQINNQSITKNDLTNIFEGKNLILILAESLIPQAIDEELTPTLYKLANDGYYFDNFYAPLYPSNTCDAEFISQTSIMPSIETGTTSYAYVNNYYPYSLANMLKQKGYYCNSYHSFEKSFYNREPFHEALGFSFFFAKDDLNIYTDENFVEYYNWVDDRILFEKMLEKTNFDKPFYNFVITASGHLPYMDLREELYENQSIANEHLKEDPETAYYYASQMKLDEGIRYLIDELNTKGILKDTVIVIFGDHYPYGANDTTQKYLFKNIENEYEKQKTPFIIYNSEIKGKKNSKLTSTFDILPTLSNLFGLNTNNAYIIGNDVFSSKESYVLFSDRSILTNQGFFNSATQNSGVDKEYLNKLLDIYDISQDVLKGDYYRKYH